MVQFLQQISWGIRCPHYAVYAAKNRRYRHGNQSSGDCRARQQRHQNRHHSRAFCYQPLPCQLLCGHDQMCIRDRRRIDLAAAGVHRRKHHPGERNPLHPFRHGGQGGYPCAGQVPDERQALDRRHPDAHTGKGPRSRRNCQYIHIRHSHARIFQPVSYTHLDVYKRQGLYNFKVSVSSFSGTIFATVALKAIPISR